MQPRERSTGYLRQNRLNACCRYFDFVNFNTTGYRPYVTTLYAVLLGCLRKSISRILVLIVSMGFGVVLPYLGAIQHKVSTVQRNSDEDTLQRVECQGACPRYPQSCRPLVLSQWVGFKKAGPSLRTATR